MSKRHDVIERIKVLDAMMHVRIHKTITAQNIDFVEFERVSANMWKLHKIAEDTFGLDYLYDVLGIVD